MLFRKIPTKMSLTVSVYRNVSGFSPENYTSTSGFQSWTLAFLYFSFVPFPV